MPQLPTATKMTRAWAALREGGPRIFWLKLASELGYRRLLVLERSLEQPVAADVPTVPVRIEVLSSGGVDDYLTLRPEARREQVQQRWDVGHLCFAARHEGRLVACCWAALAGAWSDYLRCAVELAPGEAYLFDAYTLPAWRGRGIAHAVCMQQLSYLRQAGRRRVIRMTAAENTVALQVHAKAGFRPAGAIVSLGIGPRRRIFRRSWNKE